MAKTRELGTRTPVKRVYTENKTVLDRGTPCPRCGERYQHSITNTYPNGNRRRICGKCNNPFVTMRINEEN